jgi:uncharacterized protein (UPF0332 family)
VVCRSAQNQRGKSVSEKIIKEGEIGELVGKSRTSSCSFRKTFYLKDNKSTKRNNIVSWLYFYANKFTRRIEILLKKVLKKIRILTEKW